MKTLQEHVKHIPAMIAYWMLLLGSLLASTASATCISNSDPDMRRLQELVDRDPRRALAEAASALQAPARIAVPAEMSRRASLFAVEAEAYGILELAAEARQAASQGLQLVTDIRDPVHLELLSAYSEKVYDKAGISSAIAAIDVARSAQPQGSLADTCLLITRGLLEHRQDRPDLAIVSLTQAYHASASPTLTEPHILSAAVLSVLMRNTGDYAHALVLNQEVIDWDTSHHATTRLSVSRFMRGQILRLSGAYESAIAEFAQARQISVSLADLEGVAYADLRSCEAHIELGAIGPAQRECDNALRIFSGAHSESVKDTQVLLARIDLLRGRPEAAVVRLNHVLEHDGADMAPLHVAPIYDWRARAYAALRRYRKAYGDLSEYSRRYVEANDVERHRQAETLRARFEVDRQMERNASLQRELEASREQSQRQARQLKLNRGIALGGVLTIALLVYFLSANHRYRKQLLELATRDSLTGLANRRRTAEFATTALESVFDTQRPLSIALIDLDNFKMINDRCGHSTGDFVLREFARMAGEAIRSTDLMGRWGGEEFLLVMPDATVEVAAAELERIRTLLYAIRLPATGAGMRVSFSAGIAHAVDIRFSLDELVARADRALYAAKNEGRDTVRVADAGMTTGTHSARRVSRE